MLAFDKPCEGITEGRQHFILYEYRNKNGQGKKSYYLLSGFEHFDNSSSVPGQGIPAPNPILNVHFTGGGMMYGGVEESRKGSQLIVRMRKRYLFAPPCKLCFFSGNNAKPKQEENVELEVFLTAVDNGNDSFLSINKIIRHGTNSLSGNKPLLYDLEKILGDTIRMQKAYDSCQSGNICK